VAVESDDLRQDISRARRGEREALDRVLTAVQSRLRAAAVNRLGSPLRAKMATSDLLQSTYVDVVRSIHDFRGDDPDTLVAWITRIMDNNLRDRLRFFGRERRRNEQQHDEPIDGPANDPTPSFEAIQVENLAAVGKALTELPEDQRQIIELRLIEGCDYDEIAERLGRSHGALRMLLSRARAALAMRLDQLLDEPR